MCPTIRSPRVPTLLPLGLITLLAMTLLTAAIPSAAEGEEPKGQRWEQLSLATIGADRFLQEHPQWDGRGVLIAICDSGVELDLTGLETTSDGKPKVLEAREMTDEGRVTLEVAEHDSDERGAGYHAEDGPWLYGADALSPSPAAGSEVLIGFIEEKAWLNSAIDDLDNNGRTDDVFGLIAFQAEEKSADSSTSSDEAAGTGNGSGSDQEDRSEWVVFVDTNADGDLADESPIRDYAVARETLTLGPKNNTEASARIAYGINLWPEKKEAALYFDGNGHGTHVAGAAAGFRINGQAGYNGIAPGAQILAYKIGNNSMAGGATTAGSMISAWRHAIDKAEELEMPLVIQMSYGIGSEQEGRAVAERLIDSMLEDNPDVVATLSAGNGGPGLSTVGLPSSADEVFAVGAAFARTTAEIVYGIRWEEDRIFPFSARGAELAKPDMMAPGFEASTVPTWSGRDVFRGTSMAAPQAAGATAVLMSAAMANDLPIRRDLIRAAIQRTARFIPGYGPLDQGPGMIDIPRAWQAYKTLAQRDPNHPVRYSVTTESAELVEAQGATVFYRGRFFPLGEQTHDIRVSAVFPDEAPEELIRGYYLGLDLEPDAAWVRVDKPSTYIRQDGSARIPIRFLARSLTKPGLYQARLLAYDRKLDRKQRSQLGPELVVPIAVVVPVDLENGPVVHEASIKAAGVDRLFFRVTPWTGSIDINIELPRSSRDRGVVAVLHDPEGRRKLLGRMNAQHPTLDHRIPARLIESGVWELAIWGNQSNLGPANVVTQLSGLALVMPANPAIELSQPAGRTPSGKIELTSASDQTWRGTAKASVVGVVRTQAESISSLDHRHSLRLAPEEKSIAIALRISPDDWSLFTDVAVQVLDTDGKAIVQTGFANRLLDLSLSRSGGAEPAVSYSMQVVPGVADPDAATPSWSLDMRELHRYTQPIQAKIKQGGDMSIVLFPDRPSSLSVELESTPPSAPDGFSWLLELELTPDDGRQPGLTLELEAR